MEAFWLKRLGHHICHIALRKLMAEGDLLLLGILPCNVVGHFNVLGALRNSLLKALWLKRLGHDGVMEEGKGCCIVYVKKDASIDASVTAFSHL